MAQRIKRALLGLLACLVVAFTPLEVEASDAGIGTVDEFNSLTGDAKYLGSSYRNNYYVDIEETGVMDSGYEMLNNIVNMIFGVIRLLVYLTCVIFFHSMSFDLGALMTDFINELQQSLIDSVFWPLFMIGLAFVSFTAIKNFAKRNMMGSLMEYAKVIIIILLTYFFARETDTVLTYTTQITKEISLQAMMEIGFSDSNTNRVKSYAASAAGGLWDRMLHEPWLIVEFGGTEPTADVVNRFMTNKVGSEYRNNDIKNYNENTGAFAMTRGAERISFLILYLIPCILKCVILIAVSVIQFALQAVAVFYILLVPLVLIMAMFPDYGFTVFEWWWKKFLESQLGVLLMTFVIGFIFRIEEVLYRACEQIGIGWMITLGFELIIVAVVIKYHREILQGITKVKDVKAYVDDYAYRHRRRDDYYEDDYDDYEDNEDAGGGRGSYEHRRMRQVSYAGESTPSRSLNVYDSEAYASEGVTESVRPSLQPAPIELDDMVETGTEYVPRRRNVDRNISIEERDLSGGYEYEAADADEVFERPLMENAWDSDFSEEEYAGETYYIDEVQEMEPVPFEEPMYEEPAEESEPPRPRLRLAPVEEYEKDNVIEFDNGRRIETDFNRRMGR